MENGNAMRARKQICGSPNSRGWVFTEEAREVTLHIIQQRGQDKWRKGLRLGHTLLYGEARLLG